MEREVYIQCFFEPSHVILKHRMPYHYQRCTRQHPNIRHNVCPYSAIHIMVPEDYQDHLTKCDLRPVGAVSNGVTDQSAAEALPPASGDSWEKGEEEWATEAPVVPQIVKEGTFIYSPCIGGCRTERVNHKLTERLVCQQIEDSKTSNGVQADKKKKKKKKKKSSNSQSNSENVNGASGNKSIPTNSASNAPLAEQKIVKPEDLNFAKLSLIDCSV